MLVQGILLLSVYPRFHRSGSTAKSGMAFGALAGLFLATGAIWVEVAKFQFAEGIRAPQRPPIRESKEVASGVRPARSPGRADARKSGRPSRAFARLTLSSSRWNCFEPCRGVTS